MKKILILISLFFVTVCYAAPPPDEMPALFDNQELVLDVDAVVNVPVQGIEVQEVTFCYIGNAERFASINHEIEKQDVYVLIRWDAEPALNFKLNELKKPPLFYCSEGSIQKNLIEFQRNLQHSNYGYPFTGDRC